MCDWITGPRTRESQKVMSSKVKERQGRQAGGGRGAGGGGGGDGGGGDGDGGGWEMTKEEKEARINKKMEEIRKKNEAIQKRHQEIEEDKKSAKDKNANLDMRRQTSSLVSHEGSDLTHRLGHGVKNQADGVKGQPSLGSNEVVHFGPEFNMNLSAERKKIRPSLYAAGRGRRLASLQGKAVDQVGQASPQQQQQQQQTQQQTQLKQHHDPVSNGYSHPLNPFVSDEERSPQNLKRRSGAAGRRDEPASSASRNRDGGKPAWHSGAAPGAEGRRGGRPKGGKEWRRNENFEDAQKWEDGTEARNETHPNEDAKGDANYATWRKERAAIDDERVKRAKSTSGSWKRAWDAEKGAERRGGTDAAFSDSSAKVEGGSIKDRLGERREREIAAVWESEEAPQRFSSKTEGNANTNRNCEDATAAKSPPHFEDGVVKSTPQVEEGGAKPAPLFGARQNTKNIKGSGSRIGSGRFLNTGDSRLSSKATSPPTSQSVTFSAPSVSAAPPTTSSTTPRKQAVSPPRVALISISSSLATSTSGRPLVAPPTFASPTSSTAPPLRAPAIFGSATPVSVAAPPTTLFFGRPMAPPLANVDVLASKLQPTAVPFVPTPKSPPFIGAASPAFSPVAPAPVSTFSAPPSFAAPTFAAIAPSPQQLQQAQLIRQRLRQSQQVQQQQQYQTTQPAPFFASAPATAPAPFNLQPLAASFAMLQQQQQQLHKRAEQLVEQPSKRLNSSESSNSRTASYPRVTPANASLQAKPRRSGGRTDISSHARNQSRTRYPSGSRASQQQRQPRQQQQLVKIQMPADLQPGWRQPPRANNVAVSPDKISLPASPSSASSPAPSASSWTSSPEKSGASDSGAPSTSRRVEALGHTLKIKLRLSPEEALRLAEEDLRKSAEAAWLPDDDDSTADAAFTAAGVKAENPEIDAALTPRANDLAEQKVHRESDSLLTSKETLQTSKDPGNSATDSNDSTSKAADFNVAGLLDGRSAKPQRTPPKGSQSLKSQRESRRPNPPSFILSPKSKILADIKKQRENRSREDEIELDEYNPEDELDELLLKPEDILGEGFSLTSGIEGLCVERKNDGKKVTDQQRDESTDSANSKKAQMADDAISGGDDDDDEWEDISHDDEDVENDDGEKEDVKDSSVNPSNKLSILLHDDCVALVDK